MNSRSIIKALFGAGIVTAVGFELGLFQRAFDSRSIIEDGVVGSGFWIVKVDGKPAERIQHGFVMTKVPFALVEPGDRLMELSVTPHPSDAGELVEFQATIEKGVNYRISRNKEGNAELIAKK